MVPKNPQNTHMKYYWPILVTFMFDIKIDVNMCELRIMSIYCFFVNLLHSPCVWLFDILTYFFNLNHLSPSQGYFFYFCLLGGLSLH